MDALRSSSTSADRNRDRRMARPKSGRQGRGVRANRIKYKGNWKLAYDNSCDGYHVAIRTGSLLETENRFAGDNAKGMSY